MVQFVRLAQLRGWAEPSIEVDSINQKLSFGLWRTPSYLLLMRRDGDVSKALMADSMDWHLKKEDS